MKTTVVLLMLAVGAGTATAEPYQVVLEQRVIRRLPNADEQARIDLKQIRKTVVPAAVQPLVDDLADPIWSVRESATDKLRVMTVPDEALMKVLDEWSLVQEQRHRLLNILDDRITSRKRGALGIRMTPNNVDGIFGIVVTDLLPGLPARRVLQVGDVIRRIDEVVIRNNEDLIKHVQKLPPGRRVEVEVLRPLGPDDPEPVDPEDLVVSEAGRRYEVVEVEFALGSYDKLGDDPRVSNPETSRRRLMVRKIRERWAAPVDPVGSAESPRDEAP